MIGVLAHRMAQVFHRRHVVLTLVTAGPSRSTLLEPFHRLRFTEAFASQRHPRRSQASESVSRPSKVRPSRASDLSASQRGSRQRDT
jgi:hypothetical protein